MNTTIIRVVVLHSEPLLSKSGKTRGIIHKTNSINRYERLMGLLKAKIKHKIKLMSISLFPWTLMWRKSAEITKPRHSALIKHLIRIYWIKMKDLFRLISQKFNDKILSKALRRQMELCQRLNQMGLIIENQ